MRVLPNFLHKKCVAERLVGLVCAGLWSLTSQVGLACTDRESVTVIMLFCDTLGQLVWIVRGATALKKLP